MTMEEHPIEDSSGSATHHPPVTPDAMVTPVRSAWPSVVGGISIALGVIGVLGALCGTGFMLAVNIWSEEMEEFAESGMMMSGDQMVWTLMMSVISLGFSIALLTCGISLCRRRFWSAGGIQWWAGLYIPYAFVSTIIGAVIQHEQTQAQLAAQDANTAAISGAMSIFMVVGTVFGLVFSCALPVFILIWFRRAAVKREVATWT